ncbi:hypothetical protein P175DRAFT_0434633 [Aspergillus ochraceoroseus IBT 24754]|uniref:Sialidase n=2 Tax=Aspergillus ochraceoroseus TaxID=138278 RepID=A0A2T5LZJ2_9EURO|nr:uncharacterized protein P175DRAFT_0434633 [Aspergillus ochraceoroseus IBT 24754]KKK12294.1 hypothetical protein AOCH_004279 [Aspergillus ochraceoroseus]PTU21708.1 hypothetical protein P175DRAFT_0434633 [Aspergillus ochraceoroseus IBT 24754]
MSVGFPYYRPTTPPAVTFQGQVGPAHNRNASDSSVYSNDSSPWSAITSTTSPTVDSPPRYHHGPALLPKIRSQDVVIEPPPTAGPQRHRRVLSNTRNPPGFLPYPPRRQSIQRNVVEASDRFAAASSVQNSPTYASYNGSTLSSPVSIKSSHKRRESGGHSRSGSASSIDEEILNRYGYPTYRQLPKYTTQPQPSPTAPATPDIVVYPPHLRSSPAEPLGSKAQEPAIRTSLALPPTPYRYAQALSGAQGSSTVGLAYPNLAAGPHSTTLLSYLTGQTQAINLVRNLSVVPTRGLHDYFWWDIRNLRSWSSFSLPTFNSINGLTKLLKTTIPSQLTPPTVVPSSKLSPDSETALINLIQDIYAPRVNAALAVSQGPDHLSLYTAPVPHTPSSKNYGGPHFLANYASDTEQTSSGLPRGRLVGIAKSFDRWNTGMRNEAPHRRVEYLNGLAHLQRCIREHSCRYGFIITEIELVCVRAGCDEGDDVPYFGFLELSTPIPTNIAAHTARTENCSALYASPNSPTPSVDSSFGSQSPLQENYPVPASEALNVPMTASLALYFLLMLSKSVPLPSQPSCHLNVGGPGALTRQRTLPEGKDKWIPEPQIGERRDAKRVRGWVWPQDAWHRREGGGVPRSRTTLEVKQKKWHK